MIPVMGLHLADVDLMTETVSSPRLLLRPWRHDDAAEVYRACQDPLIQTWVVAVPSPYTKGDARDFVSVLAWTERKAGTGMQFAVVLRDSGRLVASAGLMRLTGPLGPEVGYWVAPLARGHGYAAEATDALAAWAFDHGFRRVSLLAAPDNGASCRTAERAGFSPEGLLREAETDRDGRPRNLVRYARLAGDAPAPTFG